MRMLMNNLDPEVAEDPENLIVYGGSGKAARDWPSFQAIIATLKRLEADETLLVQSGKPVGVMKTHAGAPRVLIANSNLVGEWANWEHFRHLEAEGKMMYGQMTAGSWIYIGTQGILQGTYETFSAAAERHFGGTLRNRLVVTAGLRPGPRLAAWLLLLSLPRHGSQQPDQRRLRLVLAVQGSVDRRGRNPAFMSKLLQRRELHPPQVFSLQPRLLLRLYIRL